MLQQIQLIFTDLLAFTAVIFMVRIFYHDFRLKQAEEKYGWGSGELRRVYQEQLGQVVFWFGGLALVIFLLFSVSHI